MKKDITFIYMDKAEYQNYYPIYEEALKRGYTARFTIDKFEKCEIGIYCQHVNFPQFSKFSVIMLHDITQAYGRWPDIWYEEPWYTYDIGILPGKKWSEMWHSVSDRFYTRPKRHMYEVGWPKADKVNMLDKEQLRKEYEEKYGLDPNKRTILYAPAWENDNKQDEFVKAMQKLDVNILIKQAPWPSNYPHIIANIEEMNKLHRGLENVFILDPEVNIMDAIVMSDILVSEESSTMCEAVMLGVPAVSVSNWLIPDCTPSRYPKDDYDFVVKTTKEELKDTVEKILNDYDNYKDEAKEFSKDNFGKYKSSSKVIMDIIDSYVNDTEKMESLSSKEDKSLGALGYCKYKYHEFNRKLYHYYGAKFKIIRKIINFILKLEDD